MYNIVTLFLQLCRSGLFRGIFFRGESGIHNSGRCYSLENSTLVKASLLEGSDSLNFENSSCGYNGDDILSFEGDTIIISTLNCLCTFQTCLILNYYIIS